MPEILHNRVPPQLCLWCGHLLDAATDVKGVAQPKEGDVTICIKCAHVMRFTEDLRLRNLTEAERPEVLSDELVQRALAAWRDMYDANRR